MPVNRLAPTSTESIAQSCAWLIEYLYEEGPDVNGYSFGLTTRSKTRRGRKLSTLYRFLDGKTGSVRRAPAGPIQPGSSCDQIFSGTLPEKRTSPSGACARWPQ